MVTRKSDFFQVYRTEPGLLSRLFFFVGKMRLNQSLENGNFARKQNVLLTRFLKIGILLAVVAALFFTAFFLVSNYKKNHISVKSIKDAWKVYDYQKVYDLGHSFLLENPFNNTVLAYYGYASYYLAQSQTDSRLTQTYLDESINSLRVALFNSSKSLTPQLQYMLGMAYFYKNSLTSHCYADLAVKYLTLARENGYKADDIPEYLGLSYASLGLPMDSISAFTEALLYRESDSLLLSIAEQYYKAREYSAAEQYLFRIIKNSENDEIIIKSENLLGNIYIDKEDYDAAMQEFENVLKKNENSADAHYGIGVIYEKQGNIVKARAEWRKTQKIQVNHAGALQKLSDN